MIEEESSRMKEKLLRKYDIPVENLSYEYIKKCEDVKELEKIIKILRSGEEGQYPDLLQSAENRLKGVCPSNRLLIKPEPICTPSSLTADDRNKLSSEMSLWSDEMKEKEALLKGAGELLSPTFPPIRNHVDNSVEKKTESVKKCSIKSLDYEAWEKYDPDKEILNMEIEEDIKKEEYSRNKQAKPVNNSEEPIPMDYENYSETEKQFFAKQEKDRGNECYKAGQYEEATEFYTKSINILPNVTAYNNRAIANLKLQKYGEVITDCNEVLRVEPQNVKALFRRGRAHQFEGRLNEAMEDFIQVLEVDPTITSAKSSVSELKKKLEETSEGKPKKARMVVEDMKSFEEELKSIKIFDKKGYANTSPKPVQSRKKNYHNDHISYGDNEINEWGYSRILCTCNSIPYALQKKSDPHCKNATAETGKSSIQIANKYSNQGSKSQTIIEGKKKQKQLTEEKVCDNRMLGCSSVDSRNVKKSPPRDMPTINDEDSASSKGDMCDDTLSRNRVGVTSPCDNSEEKPMEVCENNEEEMFLESPVTPYDFLRIWNQLSEEKTFVKHARLLKRIEPSNLSRVIGTELDGYMLSAMLNSLKSHFDNEEEVLQYLVSISNLPRFKAMWTSLSAQDIEVVKELFSHLEKSGKFEVKEELKMAYLL